MFRPTAESDKTLFLAVVEAVILTCSLRLPLISIQLKIKHISILVRFHSYMKLIMYPLDGLVATSVPVRALEWDTGL